MELQTFNTGADAVLGQPPRRSPQEILAECRELDAAIANLQRTIQQLDPLHEAALQQSGSSSAATQQLDAANATLLREQSQLAQRVQQLKTTPGAGQPSCVRQVNFCSDKLTQAFQAYQAADMRYRRRFQDQLVRQYRVVHPDATQQEALRLAESDGGVFAQAIAQSDRTGQSQSTLRAVQSRHDAIQKVERQMEELAVLFEQMNGLVVQQEPVVAEIANQSENIKDDVERATGHLDGAVEKARAARRKKWMCLGLTILIVLLIIGIVVLIYELYQHNIIPH